MRRFGIICYERVQQEEIRDLLRSKDFPTLPNCFAEFGKGSGEERRLGALQDRSVTTRGGLKEISSKKLSVSDPPHRLFQRELHSAQFRIVWSVVIYRPENTGT